MGDGSGVGDCSGMEDSFGVEDGEIHEEEEFGGLDLVFFLDLILKAFRF